MRFYTMIFMPYYIIKFFDIVMPYYTMLYILVPTFPVIQLTYSGLNIYINKSKSSCISSMYDSDGNVHLFMSSMSNAQLNCWLFLAEEPDGITKLTAVIIAVVTVFLMVIIGLAVKYRKLQTAHNEEHNTQKQNPASDDLNYTALSLQAKPKRNCRESQENSGAAAQRGSDALSLCAACALEELRVKGIFVAIPLFKHLLLFLLPAKQQ
uniref:Uncharacterized protein n=1 Tax=Seriola dumerili TaxID=41447 RepID=A0A3B4V4M9_SERDU